MLVFIILVVLGAPAYASKYEPGAVSVTSADLLERAAELDGERVVFQGEAIGDVMRRGTHGWVNIHDGGSAIGVWAPVSLLEGITFAGDYGHVGDIVRVEGVFRQNCPEHDGDIDIHAERFTIVGAGEPVSHPISTNKAVAALILVPIAAALFFVERYRRRHPIGGS